MGLFGFGGGGDYLAIDFGASALKAGKATVSDETVQFSLVDDESLLDVPSEEYVDGCIEALTEIIDRNSISEKQKVLLALPANDVIIRRMELPSMPEERMAKVIGYEAESHIPFPLDQVVMDHHVISSSEDGYEIILAAIKEDNLNNHLEIIHRSGLSPEVVDVTVFSLFNLYTHMWGRGGNGDDAKPRALVDIGHGNTDIMVFEGETLYFARSASVAGGSLDQAIEKKLEVEAAEARRLKHELGHVPLEGEPTEETPGTSGMDALEQMAAEREEGEEESEEAPAPPEEEEPPPPPGAAEEEKEGAEEAPPPPSGEEEPPPAPADEEEAATEEEGGLGDLELGAPASPTEGEPEGDEAEKEESPPAPPEPPTDEEAETSTEEDVATEKETAAGEEEEEEEDEEAGGLEGLSLGTAREPSKSEVDETETESEKAEVEPPAPDEEETKSKEAEQSEAEQEEETEPPKPPEDADELKLDTAQLDEEEDEGDKETPELGQPRKPSAEEESEEDEAETEAPGEEAEAKEEGDGLDLGGGMLGGDEEEEEEDDDDEDELMGGGLSLGAAAAEEAPGESEDEEKAKAVGEAIKPKIDRLVGELRHTFDYFSSELGGGEIEEIILAGGTAKLKNLPEFISNSLDYPVRRLKVSEAIEGVEEEKKLENLVVAGLQLRSIEELSVLDFNLVPEEFIQQRQARERKKKLSVLGALAAVFVLMLAATAYLQYENRRQVYEQSLEVYGELEPIINRKDELESDRDRIAQRLRVIEELEQERARILDFLLQLSMLTDPHEGLEMGSHTWFDSFRYSRGELTIEGVTDEYEDITTIRNWIEELDYVEEEIGLEWDRESFVVGEDELDMRPFVLQFSMKFEE